MSARKAFRWVAARPWAVRLYATAAVLALPFTLLCWAGVLLYKELGSEVPDFLREVWYAIRTGKFK